MGIFNRKIIKPFEKIILFFAKFFTSKNTIRILVYHNVEKKNFKKLKIQLEKLKKNWNFITPIDFENHILKKKRLYGKNLLITFDDGFKSNLSVARSVLSKFNVKAIFFIPSDFIKFKSKINAYKFAKHNILDNRSVSKIKYLQSMSVDDLKLLIIDGHVIGSHSKSHVNLGKIYDKRTLKNEILDSADLLEKKLNYSIKHFAYPYGFYTSINKPSLLIAFSRYKFVYSCLRGNNFSNQFDNIIKRDTVYLNESYNLLDIFVSGFLDFIYFSKIQKINSIIKK